jgi:AraC family transcriptional regulator
VTAVGNTRRSQHEYDRRMHAVVDYVDKHLDAKLDLATLASVAHFSPFHFHRLFHALMSEALGDYVRRRRMESAAIRLRSQPDVPVTQIALSVGFGSPESFSRAFRAYFGVAPTEWRKRKEDQLPSKNGQVTRNRGQAARGPSPDHGASSLKEKPMNVMLVDREPVHIAYYRLTGPYGPAIAAFWKKTVAPWMITNTLLGRERYGISLDDPSVTRAERCRYDAGVASPSGEVLSGNPHRKVIPGGRYASMAYEGTSQDLPAAWQALLRDWLPKSGLQLDARPFFEHYPVDGFHDPKTGEFSCNICIPVAQLTAR